MKSVVTSPSKTPVVVPASQATETQLFFDGFSNILLGPALSKVTFYQTVGVTPEGNEMRKMSHVVVLPTAALVDFCGKVLKQVATHEKQLKAAFEQQSNLVLKPTAQKSE